MATNTSGAMQTDTIVAIATPPGMGGVAVVRLSGADALAIALKHLSVKYLPPRKAIYCTFSAADGTYIDDGIATYFVAPHSYTGEPTVEFACHGSTFVQQAIVEAFLSSGARMAEGGEYTLRAFRNGRINLSQTEAIADLIEASTPAQHRLAVSQLRGGYASKLKELRQRLVDLTALLELELDFSQEDVEFADRGEMSRIMLEIMGEVKSLLDSFAMGNALKQGIPVALVGSPNVGKSTLLNALLNDDRAIVSDIPGTTRDTVEGMLTLNGITFRLIDTAGIREPQDQVEALGIERSCTARDEALIVLEVEDISCAPSGTPHSTHQDDKHYIRVLNKCDRMSNPVPTDPPTRGDTHTVHISAKLGHGIEQLKLALLEVANSWPQRDVLLSNIRHHEALLHVQVALNNAAHGLADGMPTDLIAVDLRDALYHLGTITGDITSDEVLASVFSRFCIGK